MNRKKMILVSLALGLVAAFVAWRQTFRRDAAVADWERDKNIVVATRAIEKYEPIPMDYLQEMPQASWKGETPIPEDAIGSLDEAKDCLAAQFLNPGEPLCNRDLLSVQKLGLAAEIPPGMRAMTIEVDRVANVGGVLKPGRFVDVVVTFRDRLVKEEGQVAKTVLQGVQVLAVYRRRARTVEGETSGGNAPDNMLVTLAVTPKEASRLVLADETGKLRLALRSVHDPEWEDLGAGEMVSLRSLLGMPKSGNSNSQGSSKPQQKPRPASPPAKPSGPVRLSPPPDFSSIPAATIWPPAGTSPPSISLPPAGVDPEVPAAPTWRVKVIRGTAVETSLVNP